MIRLSINLPTKHRLDLKLVKNRKVLDTTPLLPNLGKVRRARSGNKLSRFFRLIFEHKNIKRVLGTNLVAIAIATSFIPAPTSESVNIEEIVVSQSAVELTTKVSVRYPTAEVKITQGYKIYHPGIDFDGTTGDSIYPVMDGKIEAVQYSNYAYGNAVLVNHGNELTSLYAHLSQINVRAEDEVTTNTIIGKMGATGRAIGDHLHLEVRDSGYPINPLTILPLP